MLETIPYVDIASLPPNIRKTLADLPINGGNCISVDKDTLFGKWLENRGFQFKRTNGTWDWIVVFR